MYDVIRIHIHNILHIVLCTLGLNILCIYTTNTYCQVPGPLGMCPCFQTCDICNTLSVCLSRSQSV